MSDMLDGRTWMAILLAFAMAAFAIPGAEAACDLVVEEGEDAQAAVDCAQPGDVVLLKAGTHHQALTVTTSDLTIRGEGRGVTFLDGTGINADGVFVVGDGVTVEDLTVQNYGRNGVFWQGVDGFLGQRIDAIRNGPYGLYAIQSTNGDFLDSYAEGHSDSGFYLGEVEHCNCLIANVEAVGNLIGYSGTGASDIVIRDSMWTDNAAGIVPNVLPSEPQPQFNLTIVNNLVADNNNETASKAWHFASLAHVPSGLGIVIAGGSFDVVTGNTVTGHTRAGIVVTFLFLEPSFNRIAGNGVNNPASFDILWDEGGVNNCFEANQRPDGSAATFSAGPTWAALGHLPDCSTPNAGAPSPVTTLRLASLLIFGCEPEEQPGDPCHLEGVTDDDYP